jgi:nucleoside-diphosphate-sugar epimerase
VKRAIVTGATGFVGANLARRLLRDGHEVHLLVRAGHSPWRIEALRGSVSVHEIDLTDRGATGAALARIRPQWVFHLAAHGAYPSQTDLDEMVRTNIVGTMSLVRACLETGFEAFVHAGSSSEYGFKDHPPAESERLDPNSHYAVTKATATLFCRHTSLAHDVAISTLRLYSVYGPYEEPTRLVPTLVVRGLRGELPPLVRPDIARDYVHVNDVIEAFVLTAQGAPERGAVYNVGTGVQTSLARVVDVARGALGIGVEPEWGTLPPRRWDTAVWVADARRIRSSLGWEPRYDFAEGFRRTVEWLTGHPTIHALYRRRLGLSR